MAEIAGLAGVEVIRLQHLQLQRHRQAVLDPPFADAHQALAALRHGANDQRLQAGEVGDRAQRRADRFHPEDVFDAADGLLSGRLSAAEFRAQLRDEGPEHPGCGPASFVTEAPAEPASGEPPTSLRKRT